MLQSKFLTKVIKENPKNEEATNAQLLIRSGFVEKVMAGVYNYLPLGLKVLKKIENIIREEMNALGAEEILMSVLHPKENWQQTGRWDSLDVLFRLKTSNKELALGPTHEEIVTPLAKNFIYSYKDLPKAVYQIQTKFRDEPRSKSGLLRGREFLMKDLYSFHVDQNDLDNYYQSVEKAYEKIFFRLGLGQITLKTYAAGGTFSKYSHEYQTLCPSGEDTIYICEKCHIAINKEIIKEQNICPECGAKKLIEKKSIEVGNIFKLGTKFSQAFNFNFTNEHGQKKPVIMGCYGMGPSRIMGALVEVFHDAQGIIWPESVAPYKFHLLNLSKNKKIAEKIYQELIDRGVTVLFDDRDISAGEKFSEADLIGISHRLVISEKTGNKIEYKNRNNKRTELLEFNDLFKIVK